MWQTIGLNMLFTAVRLIVTKQLFNQILEAVEAATSLPISGVDKKALVMKELGDVQTELTGSVKKIPNALLSMAVDVAYTELNVKLGKL
jgi:hypothetical protein